MDTAVSGKRSPPSDGTRADDHARAETGTDGTDFDDEDPFEDDDVTSVLDAVWDDLTS